MIAVVDSGIAREAADLESFGVDLAQLLHPDRALFQFRRAFESQFRDQVIDAFGRARVCSGE